ncbi:hypothetical protein GCM10010324_47410 [Streptomyces hiroshimensis]|uniref:Uncharacterized protein n=1 Tax=Streptomyces hiroshimensis TaxID=66424 RepID=A0ABQ2YWQ8_9ACTN|nr:hypothetical protein GCM10010324_47410 [Streptomyces hiroshimensis]
MHLWAPPAPRPSRDALAGWLTGGTSGLKWREVGGLTLPLDTENPHVRDADVPLGLLPLPGRPAPLPRCRAGCFPLERAGTRGYGRLRAPRAPLTQKGA